MYSSAFQFQKNCPTIFTKNSIKTFLQKRNMFRILQRITLKGITQKGKNRINEHGNEWIIVKVDTNTLNLQAVKKSHKIKDELFYYEMTISTNSDPNFKINV